MIPLFKVWMAEDLSRVNSVLRSGYIGQGAVVEEFESRLAERIGSPYVLAVNSGTSALDLALSVIGVGPGDEVISTPMTCSATNHAINNRGAQLVWADIDPISGLISPESIASAVTPATKAIVVVDWGGERLGGTCALFLSHSGSTPHALRDRCSAGITPIPHQRVISKKD